jgi:hypothetical protein
MHYCSIPNEILSTSQLDRSMFLHSAILNFSGHFDDTRSNHDTRLRRSPSRIRLRYLFRMGWFFQQTNRRKRIQQCHRHLIQCCSFHFHRCLDAIRTISFKHSKWDRSDGGGSSLEIGRTCYSLRRLPIMMVMYRWI